MLKLSRSSSNYIMLINKCVEFMIAEIREFKKSQTRQIATDASGNCDAKKGNYVRKIGKC